MGWTDLFGGEVIGIGKKYLKKQLREMERYIMLAVAIEGIPGTQAQVERIVKKAGKWALKHGNPTRKEVAEDLAK